MLRQLAVELSDRNISHRIITEDQPKEFEDRIQYLAQLRNRALEPLFTTSPSSSSSLKYDKIIFFNDIVYDPRRFLQMFDRMDGKYDAICGLDYSYNFYDTFVMREEMIGQGHRFGGLQPSLWMPLFYHPDRQWLMRHGQLTPVFSCWNGVAVFNAAPFYRHKLLFRALPIIANQTVPYSASECCLIFSDFHRLGYKRVYVDPQFIARYHSATGLETIVYWWEWLWSAVLSYKPRLQPGVRTHFKAVHRQGELDGLDSYDLTCVQ